MAAQCFGNNAEAPKGLIGQGDKSSSRRRGRCRHMTTVYRLLRRVSLRRARHRATPHDKESAVTQTMMPDRTVLAARRGPDRTILASGSGEGAAAAATTDGADLAAAVRALEARKALLAGAVAALAAPDGLAAELFEAALADPDARQWPFDLA